MKIKTRIIVLATLLPFLAGGIGVISFLNLKERQEEIGMITQGQQESLQELKRISDLHERHTRLFKKTIAKAERSGNGGHPSIKEVKGQYKNTCQRVDELIEDHQVHYRRLSESTTLLSKADIQTLKEGIEELGAGHDQCEPIAKRVFEFIEAGDMQKASKKAREFLANEASIRRQLLDLFHIQSQLEEKALQKVREEGDKASTTMAWITAGFVLFGGIAGLWIAGKVALSLRRASRIARRIREGERSIDFPELPKDETRDLILSMKKMLVALRNSERANEQLNRTLEQKVERKTQALTQYNKRLNLVADNIAEVIYLISYAPKGVELVYVNDRVRDLLGYSPEEFEKIKEDPLELIHPDDRHAYEKTLDALKGADGKVCVTYRFREGENGQYQWVEETLVPRRNGSGQLTGVFGVIRETTQQKEMERV